MEDGIIFFNRDKHDQFVSLYVEHEVALSCFVRSLVRTQDDAREVMQDTAVVLWKKFEQLDSLDDFRRWGFGVARFQALSYRRDLARDRHVFSEGLMELLEAEAEEAAKQCGSEEKALQKCLSKLPGEQNDLIIAAYMPGKRIDEMALIAGRSPMSLYKKLHRIRMVLANCIEVTLKREAQ